jgi:hypothetical protein
MTNETQLTMTSHKMEMVPLNEMKAWYDNFVQFSKQILKSDLDYGVIPGVSKPSLFKPGAEKLRFVYGLTTEMVCTEKTVDYGQLLIDYTYKCTVKSRAGQVLAECEGNANSFEPKFAYLWMTEDQLPSDVNKESLKTKGGKTAVFEFEFAINRAETTGQYGKPTAYWEEFRKMIASGKAKPVMRKTKKGELRGYEYMTSKLMYRVPNPDVLGLKNTIMKMSQKRAFVGAMLIATGASEFYTQDVEDMELFGIEEKTTVTPTAEVVKEEKTTKTTKKTVEKSSKGDVEEGEVVSEPTNDPIRRALIDLLVKLEKNGKIKLDKKLEEMTTDELKIMRDQFRKTIGK